MNKIRIKSIFLTGLLFAMPLAGSSLSLVIRPHSPSEELKIVIEGLAPLVALSNGKRQVDVIAVGKDKDGNDFAKTIFQNIQAVKAEPNAKGNSIVTLYWKAKDYSETSASAKLEEFKKENTAAVFYLSVRNWKDDKTYDLKVASFVKLFE
jgi:hypothetical protein